MYTDEHELVDISSAMVAVMVVRIFSGMLYVRDATGRCIELIADGINLEGFSFIRSDKYE